MKWILHIISHDTFLPRSTKNINLNDNGMKRHTVRIFHIFMFVTFVCHIPLTPQSKLHDKSNKYSLHCERLFFSLLLPSIRTFEFNARITNKMRIWIIDLLETTLSLIVTYIGASASFDLRVFYFHADFFFISRVICIKL